MSEPNPRSHHLSEQSEERARDDEQPMPEPTPLRPPRPAARNGAHPASPALVLTAVKDAPPSEQQRHTGSAASNTHRDLNQIIARARDDIKRLREDLTRHETQMAAVVHERDELAQHYSHLYDNFIEAVHLAADEEVVQAAHSLRVEPARIPALFEPIQEAIIAWTERQQAEREAILRQKLDIVEQQAALIRADLVAEREALQADRAKLDQDRQTMLAQLKARETALQNRWVVKAWGTAAVMFLVLPALQVYLLLQKASGWNLIIIPTTICLTLTALINLVRARARPVPKKAK